MYIFVIVVALAAVIYYKCKDRMANTSKEECWQKPEGDQNLRAFLFILLTTQPLPQTLYFNNLAQSLEKSTANSFPIPSTNSG